MSKDFVYMQIYKGAKAAGAKERQALNAVITGLADYKKGRFVKASKLIEAKIKEAKRNS